MVFSGRSQGEGIVICSAKLALTRLPIHSVGLSAAGPLHLDAAGGPWAAAGGMVGVQLVQAETGTPDSSSARLKSSCGPFVLSTHVGMVPPLPGSQHSCHLCLEGEGPALSPPHWPGCSGSCSSPLWGHQSVSTPWLLLSHLVNVFPDTHTGRALPTPPLQATSQP